MEIYILTIISTAVIAILAFVWFLREDNTKVENSVYNQGRELRDANVALGKEFREADAGLRKEFRETSEAQSREMRERMDRLAKEVAELRVSSRSQRAA